MNWQTWIHSIVAAFIGGASSAVSAVIVDPASFNLTPSGLQHIGEIAVVGGVIPVLTLLKQSPLPAMSITTTATVTQEVTKQ